MASTAPIVHQRERMQLSPAALAVLQDIFSIGGDRSFALGNRVRVPTPTPTELLAYCELLATLPNEERLQRFLEEHPGFLTGLLGSPDNTDLAVLFRPALGTRYKADFCILQAHQGGCVANLVEIESSHEPLFTKKGSPARRLASAIMQLEDWRIFVSKEPKYHAGELVRSAMSLPLITNYKTGDAGFRLRDPDSLKATWEAFGGFDEPYFHFVAIVGRWSQLSSDDKARLLNRNRHVQDAMTVYTFEQVARSANFRLERDDWFNENDDWGSVQKPITEDFK